MSVPSSSMPDLFEDLPRVIGLPTCRPVRPAYRKTPFTEVCLPQELPPYLLLGHLDPAQFQSIEAAWQARWVGGTADTYVEAKYERASRRIELHQVWCGIEGGRSIVPCDDFGRAVQLLYIPFPDAWDRAMAPALERAYRLRYLPTGNHCGFTGIPDGGFKSILVPVPMARLAAAFDCFAELSNDPALGVPLGGRLETHIGAVNYVVGRGPAWTESPDELYFQSWQACGLLPICWPQLEHANDGTSAWTLRRILYLAVITVPFAGLSFVIERLAGHGIIGRADEGASEPGIEFDAFVTPAGLEATGESLASMNDAKSRRVFYQLNTPEASASSRLARQLEAHEQSCDEARELVRQATLVSLRQRRWFADVIDRKEGAA